MKAIPTIIIILIVLVAGYLVYQSVSAPEAAPETNEEAVKGLLAEKHNKDLSGVTISIEKEDEDHIMGGVQFQPGGPGNAGMFLAARKEGSWDLVFDGNGTVPCSAISPYNFPVSMVKECFDEETGEGVDRAREACISSGGAATTTLCCKSTADWPNLCLIGACGCAPDQSHEVRVCDCGENRCFNGEECVQIDSEL